MFAYTRGQPGQRPICKLAASQSTRQEKEAFSPEERRCNIAQRHAAVVNVHSTEGGDTRTGDGGNSPPYTAYETVEWQHRCRAKQSGCNLTVANVPPPSLSVPATIANHSAG